MGGAVIAISGALVACAPASSNSPELHSFAVSGQTDWLTDAWENFSAGVSDKAEARIGFDATYAGTYSSAPSWGDGYQVLESRVHPGVYHVFRVSAP